jgi:hypothetical protein
LCSEDDYKILTPSDWKGVMRSRCNRHGDVVVEYTEITVLFRSRTIRGYVETIYLMMKNDEKAPVSLAA